MSDTTIQTYNITVGEFIDILAKYPRDYTLDLYKENINPWGGLDHEIVYQADLKKLDNIKTLEVVFSD